jgi:hypothetical protein
LAPYWVSNKQDCDSSHPITTLPSANATLPFGFTAGGPIHRNKTFFFAGFQQEYDHSTSNNPMQIPTADAVIRLQSLFPSNPRLDLYLGGLGNLRGTSALQRGAGH